MKCKIFGKDTECVQGNEIVNRFIQFIAYMLPLKRYIFIVREIKLLNMGCGKTNLISIQCSPYTTHHYSENRTKNANKK